MSDYIARAQVKVEPSTVGFEKELRTKLKPILAKPVYVTVVPTTTGFAAALAKKLADLKAIPVAVIPTKLEAFRAAINAQSVPVEIPVVFNSVEMRAALAAAVATAEAGVVATIPVVAAGGKAEISGVQAALASLTTQMEKLAVAQTAVAKGSQKQGKAGKTLVKTGDVQARVTKSLAAFELALVDVQNASLSVQERLTAAQVAATEQKSAYGAAIKAVAAESTFATRADLEAARVAGGRLATEQTVLASLQERAAEEKAIAGIIQTKNRVEQQATAILKTEIAVLTDVNILEKQRAAASKLVTELKTLEARATKLNAGAIAEELAARRAELVTFVDAAKKRQKIQQDELKAERKAQAQRVAAGKTTTGQLNFARRGAAATALSLLGIRGATLASTGAFLAGAAAASLFAISVKSSVDLEQELNVFQVTAKATADQMEQVRITAEELGRDIRLPGISAAEAATAMTSLAKAGLSVQDSIAGATGVLQLSIAANIDLARSTEIVASALNAFGLSGEEAIRVADVLANSANLAQGTIDDMGIAMQQAAAVGRQAGLSFEDTATFLTILARAGLRGSDAGTSLRTGLIRLINPTEKAQKILDKLGVTIRDAEGNIRPEVFQNLAAATEGMSKAQRDQTIAQLAGNDAVRAFSIIMRLTTPELVKFRQENRKLGSAAALTEARAKGLAGQARGLASNLQTTGISIGRRATPALEGLVGSLNSAVLAMSSSDQVAESLNATLTLLGESANAAGAALGVIAPYALQAASAVQRVSLSIGLAEIGVALVAYRAIPALLLGILGPAAATAKAFTALRTAIAVTAASVAIGGPLSTGLLGLRAGFARAGAAALAFASTVQGVAIISSIVAGGIFYLATRESALEKAQKSLKESTDALSQSMSAYTTAAQAAATATSAVSTEKLSAETAALNVELAKAALRNSDAAKGSLERRQLENALAVAIDNQRLSQERVTEAIKRSREAQDEAAVAEKNRNRARKKALDDIQTFIDKETERAQLIAETGPAGAEKAYLILVKSVNGELDKRIATLEEENTVVSRDLAKRLGVIKDLQREQDRLLEPREWKILLNADSVEQGLTRLARYFGIKGGESTKNWVENAMEGLKPFSERINASIQSTLDGLIAAFGRAGAAATAAFITTARPTRESGGIPKAVERLTPNQILGRVAGIERRRQEARIAGATQAEEAAFLREEEAIVRARLNAGNLTVVQRKRLNDELERITGELESINNSIVSAEEDAARKAEEAADKAKAARDKREQAFLDLLGRREQKVLNIQARFADTEQLSDDIRINKTLKKLYKRQINKIKERVKDKETRNAAIRALQAKIFQLDLDLPRLLKQQAEQRKANIRERFQLDIDYFSSTENRRGEINARKRFIAYLKKLQDDTKKGTLEYKRLRNEIAEQEQALKDLRAETKKRNNAFNELTFEFMQAQQGFVSNLLGNLIPLGAGANLVGRTVNTGGDDAVSAIAQSTSLGGIDPLTGRPVRESGAPGIGTPGQRLIQNQGRQAVQPPAGRDQAASQIHLLQSIHRVLSRMERRERHPESRRAKNAQGSSFETMNHGPSSRGD